MVEFKKGEVVRLKANVTEHDMPFMTQTVRERCFNGLKNNKLIIEEIIKKTKSTKRQDFLVVDDSGWQKVELFEKVNQLKEIIKKTKSKGEFK